MMETLIVILIVAGAAVYVGRIFFKGFKQKDGCACGCTCCSISDSCSESDTGRSSQTAAARKAGKDRSI